MLSTGHEAVVNTESDKKYGEDSEIRHGIKETSTKDQAARQIYKEDRFSSRQGIFSLQSSVELRHRMSFLPFESKA